MDLRSFWRQCFVGCATIGMLGTCWGRVPGTNPSRPNIILVMTDDQGWGQMGYYNHPVLKTPNLDQMAANGLRFDRFYAGAPNCSPTRATIMTGRSNMRTGVNNHGYALRLQEKTLPQALQKAGYVTGHFGKWHLNGYRGPGVPVLKGDPRGPGPFGFDEWLSVTNFFDRNPLMSRMGTFEDFKGDSSEVTVAEALNFIRRQAQGRRPFFTVIWFGTPHSPFIAATEDKAGFGNLDKNSANHYGELKAMDRSIGTLRRGLRDMNIAENTLVWFCSDNGGLNKIEPDTVGGLRGNKNTIFEGGLRVPAIIEWPAVITRSRITTHPTATMDIFPTIAEIVGLPDTAMLAAQDGMSVRVLFDREIGPRRKPIGFRHTGRAALLDNHYKLLTQNLDKGVFELYNLAEDPTESNDLFASHPKIAQRMLTQFKAWNGQVETSIAGKDYPEGAVRKDEPKPQRAWASAEAYRPYIERLKRRPGYAGEIEKRTGKVFPDVEALPIQKGMPDPFVMSTGRRVETPQDWNVQRTHIKAMLEHYVYGRIPPLPRNLKVEQTGSKQVYNGQGVETQYRLTIRRRGKSASCRFLVVRPLPKKRYPTVIKNDRLPVDESSNRGESSEAFDPGLEAVKRGYLLCRFHRTDLASDDQKAGRTGGVYPLYPEYDFAALAVWGWGHGVVLNALDQLGLVDMDRVIATGHSRGGKAALVAGLYDDRVAITAPNSSGTGGTGSLRYFEPGQKPQVIGVHVGKNEHWFSARVFQFAGREDRLPFDAHFAKAAIAPRALVNCHARQDYWANPYGTELTHRAAATVFEWLGVSDRIGLHWREGGHAQNQEDWSALLDFADQYFFGKTTDQVYDIWTYPDARLPWDWQAPGPASVAKHDAQRPNILWVLAEDASPHIGCYGETAI